MFAVFGGLMFLLPMMKKNMNPEELKELEEQQAMMSDPMSMLRGILGGSDEAASVPNQNRGGVTRPVRDN